MLSHNWELRVSGVSMCVWIAVLFPLIEIFNFVIFVLYIPLYTIDDFPWGEYKDWSSDASVNIMFFGLIKPCIHRN